MDTFSFYLRVSLWSAAGILLIRALLVGDGVLDFAVVLLVGVLALGYTWLDNEMFGELVHYDGAVPAPHIKHVEEDWFIPTLPSMSFHQDTSSELVRILEDAQRLRTYVRLHYGDPETGCEERSAKGYINRSSGAVNIPLLAKYGDQGGAPVIDHQIIQVVDLNNSRVLYRHPAFHQATS